MFNKDKLLEIMNKLEVQKELKMAEMNEMIKDLDAISSKINDLKNESIETRCKLLIENIKVDLEEKKKMIFLKEKENIEKGYGKELVSYLNKINSNNSDTFVFIFSGTGKIQDVKGNRPIRMTLEFVNRNIPVLYSFWRWGLDDGTIDNWNKGILFESPVDKTLQYIKTIAKFSINKKNKIFIINFPYPEVSKYIEVFKFYGWKVIYDIRDDWEEFNHVGQAKWYNKNHELYTLSKADIITAVSSTLVKKFQWHVNKKINLVPNALDPKFLINNTNINGTKIGYVGHLTSDWFDWDSLIEVTKLLPEYEFEIIGHSMSIDIKTLPNNIKYLGPKNFDEVIEIAKGWKVAIIPFKMNKLSDAVDPIKVYEYLGMGLKVVSFRMPQIEKYPEVRIVDSIDSFSDNIRISMKEEFDFDKVLDFLNENMWSNRIDTIIKLSKEN